MIFAPVFLGACALLAQTGLPPITIKVEIVTPHAAKRPGAAKDSVDLSNIVIWLTPFAPGAGTPPPELAGRDELREVIRVAVERTRRVLPTKSILMVGLRGVGKTV